MTIKIWIQKFSEIFFENTDLSSARDIYDEERANLKIPAPCSLSRNITFIAHIVPGYFPRGWHLNIFSGKGVPPRNPKCGACEMIFASERGVLWTEFFKFGGLRDKIWAKIEAVDTKISEVLWTDF